MLILNQLGKIKSRGLNKKKYDNKKHKQNKTNLKTTTEIVKDFFSRYFLSLYPNCIVFVC